MSPLAFIVNTAGSIFVFVALLRFLLQVVRADFYNPISQIIVKITGPFLHVFRYLIPGFRNIDMASLVLAFIAEVIVIYLTIFVTLWSAASLPFICVLFLALYKLLSLWLKIYFYSLVILAISSWVAPHSRNPVLLLTAQIIEPVVSRVRRFIPPLGGLDFSFMVIIFAIMALERFLPSVFGSLSHILNISSCFAGLAI